MTIPTRNSVKILLLNDKKELLLMCADDPSTTEVDGTYHGRFWFLVGGKIEPNESLQDAAYRELYEETGLLKKDVELGPLVWFGEFDLVLDGTRTRLKQKFIVAKTLQKNVSLTNLTKWEQRAVKKLDWFSLEKIMHSKEIIYPVLLSKYLPDIISEKYPKEPFEIDLAKQPKNLETK